MHGLYHWLTTTTTCSGRDSNCVIINEGLWPKRLINIKRFNSERTVYNHSPEGLNRITSNIFLV